MKTLTAILIGAGQRGTTYVSEMKKYEDKFKVIAEADPSQGRRNKIKEMFIKAIAT